jgi:hypothetical protein
MPVPAVPDVLTSMLLQLWASLRSAHRVYWTLHWQALNYGDHLLYQRLYEARVKEIDRVAEAIAGLYGRAALDAVEGMEKEAQVLRATMAAPSPAVRAAEFVHEATRAANAAIGQHPYGIAVNNIVAGIADNALETIYLLQQRTR